MVSGVVTCDDPAGRRAGRVGVVVAGGGVGALELILALGALAGERVALTLVCPEVEFRYRPASVAVPFGGGEVYGYPLSGVAEQAGAVLRRGVVVGVEVAAHRVVMGSGERLGFDVLVVACGARRLPVLKGAVGFRGEDDVSAVQKVLGEVTAGVVRRLVFALPREASWALPLYELALLTATHIAEHRIDAASIDLVTPEDRPLAQFGGQASAEVARLLEDHHIRVHTSAYPAALHAGKLVLIPPAVLPADRVISIPGACGIPITGLPANADDFLPTDSFGRVRGVPDIYAIGDITAFPIKQGGIAAQQADLVAHVIARDAGADLDEPEPFRPLLRGLLITGGEPRYLIANPTGGKGDTAASSTEPLWWPGGKIAANYLGPYLAHAPHHQTAQHQNPA
jgi:sulfide:quinone oxidoreductase